MPRDGVSPPASEHYLCFATHRGSARPKEARHVFSLHWFDEKSGSRRKELTQQALDLLRQRRFGEGVIHQAHPAISSRKVHGERDMTHAEPGMSSGFDVDGRSSKAEDEEIPEACLGLDHVASRVHGSENIVGRNLPVECCDKPPKAVFADCRVDLIVVHHRVVPGTRIIAWGIWKRTAGSGLYAADANRRR